MPKWIRPARVRAAITALSEWRSRAKSQPAMHLWPLIALIERGVNTQTSVRFTEQDDREFWDRYGRFAGDDREPRTAGQFTTDYYIEPLVQQLKPSDYPHRSSFAPCGDRHMSEDLEFIDLAMGNDWFLWVNLARDRVFFTNSGGSFTVLHRDQTCQWNPHRCLESSDARVVAFQNAMECQSSEAAILRARMLMRLAGID